MIREGKTNPEIAREIELSVPTVAIYIQRNLEGNPNYRKGKHAHLHKEVLTYFLNHTFEETMKKFKLTNSETKSCFTAAYRKKELKHLRKDSRNHSPWTDSEFLFLMKYSGVISRKEINEHLKRGNSDIVIKEKLQKLKVCSKTLNGITLSQFLNLFKKHPEYYLQTTAGSPAGEHFKLIPWCHANEMIKSGYVECAKSVAIYIDAMAMFQKWTHGENYWDSLTSINQVN